MELTKAQFVAEYIADNLPKPGTRVRKSQVGVTVEHLTAQAEEAWMKYSDPKQVLARALEAKGGKYWNGADLNKPRVYLNDVKLPGQRGTPAIYFDIAAGTWHVQGGQQLDAAVSAAVLTDLGL